MLSAGESVNTSLSKRLAAEGTGTALLLAAVVGSGIMGDRLAAGNVAIALLANSLATGAALAALIMTFAPISGGHFNPAVTVAEAYRLGTPWSDVPAYAAVQILGAFIGVAAAHTMFAEPLFSFSTQARSGGSQAFSELVATFGLVAVILGCSRFRPPAVAVAVGSYIASAYWFTASTSFANPAVTLARCATDTFTGIRPVDVPAFLLSQAGGVVAASVLFRWLLDPSPGKP
jgi:glycerol uptake facilitator-like aquaporin